MEKREVTNLIKKDISKVTYLLEQAKDGKSWICPECGHGKGQGTTKDGISINPHEPGYLHCFSCGVNLSAFDVYMKKYNVDFATALPAVAEIYGYSIDEYTTDPATLTADQLKERINNIIKLDIRKAQANQAHPDYIAYLQKRGLSLAVANFFGCGFLEEWKNPKTLIERGKAYATPRLIIPIGDNAYLARDTRADTTLTETEKRFVKLKAGELGIFNSQAIYSADRPVFIVEGEIDAMSFYEIGSQAIGLGGTSGARKLIDLLRKIKNKDQAHREPFILTLDNDSAGQKAAEIVRNGLQELAWPFYIANPAGSFKDPNEALQKDRQGFIARVKAAECLELTQSSNIAFLATLKKKFTNTHPPMSTGFNFLDDILGGGLLTGLYFIGGVSSTGKTAFAMQVVDQIAQAGGDCLVFAAEMSRADLIARSISRETALGDGVCSTQREVQAGYSFAEYAQGKLDSLDSAYNTYSRYAERITIIENNGANMKPSAIKARIARYCHLSGKRPFVLIDYLQILTPEKERQEERLFIDDTIRALKAIATEFDLPICVISSLNRDNYTAPLNLAAFKASGNIEYGADYLLGLQLSAVHDLSAKENEKAQNLERLKMAKREIPRSVEIVLLKNRGGISDGSVRFEYDARHNLFKQSQSLDEFLETNYRDVDDQRKHRQLISGFVYSPEERAKFVSSSRR